MESNSEGGQEEGGHSSKVSQWTVCHVLLTIFLPRSDHLNHFCLETKYQCFEAGLAHRRKVTATLYWGNW